MTLMTTAMPFLAAADLRLEPGSSRAGAAPGGHLVVSDARSLVEGIGLRCSDATRGAGRC
jgi:hypothetical protein